MAPHSLSSESVWETSTYTPSSASIQALKRELRLCQPRFGGSPCWAAQGPRAVDSHDRHEPADESVLQLTLNDLQEIEDAAAFFDGV